MSIHRPGPNRPRRRHLRVASFAVVAALAMAGCGDDTDGTGLATNESDEAASTSTPATSAADGAAVGAADGDATAEGSADDDAAAATTSTPAAETTSTTAATTSTQAGPSPLEGLTIRVDEEVRFEQGGTSATIEGAVIRGERDVYRLEAAADQQLNITITSTEDNGVFDVFDPAGNLIADEQVDVQVPLPLDGDYLVMVGGTRGNVTYELTVAIPA